ncbi:MAG: hypothetical protein K2O40_08490, partial [Lachnospiraceae bacterium]|nr:hypothetical protein [Lachnospiraceae bacterium]
YFSMFIDLNGHERFGLASSEFREPIVQPFSHTAVHFMMVTIPQLHPEHYPARKICSTADSLHFRCCVFMDFAAQNILF